MFGLATAAQQHLLLTQQSQIMADLSALSAAIAANTAAIQQLAPLVAAAGTELTQLRSDVANHDATDATTQPAIDAAAAAVAGSQPALDAALAGLQSAVANQSAPTGV